MPRADTAARRRAAGVAMHCPAVDSAVLFIYADDYRAVATERQIAAAETLTAYATPPTSAYVAGGRRVIVRQRLRVDNAAVAALFDALRRLIYVKVR